LIVRFARIHSPLPEEIEMDDNSSKIGNILGVTAKILAGMVAVTAAAAGVTAFFAAKAGRNVREKIDDFADAVTDEALEIADKFRPSTASPAAS
jgi:hypothetical protein